MKHTNAITNQAQSHVRVSLALNRLDTGDMQELAIFLARNFEPITGQLITWPVVLDALNKFTEATPCITIPLPGRKSIDDSPDPSRCWVCRNPLDECTCTTNYTH